MSAATTTIIAGITLAASATTTVVSAKMASGAAKDAAALQKSSTDAALAYAKQQDAYRTTTEANRYGQMQRQTAPYRSSGVAANARMAGLLGLPAPTSESDAPAYPTPPLPGTPGTRGTPAPDSKMARWQHVREDLLKAGVSPDQLPYEPPGTIDADYGSAGQPATPAPQAGDLVLLQAPDGSTKRVPASEKDHWLSLGAKVVG